MYLFVQKIELLQYVNEVSYFLPFVVLYLIYFRIPKEDVDEIVHYEHQEHEVCFAYASFKRSIIKSVLQGT